jgi:hypothetical protein
VWQGPARGRARGYSSGQRVTARPAASRIDATSISARDSAMHPEAEEVIGERVVFQVGAVKRVRGPPLLCHFSGISEFAAEKVLTAQETCCSASTRRGIMRPLCQWMVVM